MDVVALLSLQYDVSMVVDDAVFFPDGILPTVSSVIESQIPCIYDHSSFLQAQSTCFRARSGALRDKESDSRQSENFGQPLLHNVFYSWLDDQNFGSSMLGPCQRLNTLVMLLADASETISILAEQTMNILFRNGPGRIHFASPMDSNLQPQGLWPWTSLYS